MAKDSVSLFQNWNKKLLANQSCQGLPISAQGTFMCIRLLHTEGVVMPSYDKLLHMSGALIHPVKEAAQHSKAPR